MECYSKVEGAAAASLDLSVNDAVRRDDAPAVRRAAEECALAEHGGFDGEAWTDGAARGGTRDGGAGRWLPREDGAERRGGESAGAGT